jgi:hypothetical protein
LPADFTSGYRSTTAKSDRSARLVAAEVAAWSGIGGPRRVGGPGGGDLGQDVALERHEAADGVDEGGQLVESLLKGDLDVGPGLLDPALQGNDVVVGGDDDEETDRDDDPDRERGREHRPVHRGSTLSALIAVRPGA